MTHPICPLHLALASALSFTLAACGGSSSPASSADTFSLPGTAATGAPYPDDSTVTVTDAVGASFTGRVAGGAGGYAVDVKKSAKAPFVVQVSANDLPTLVSVSTETQPSRVNVTPITHLIAATLSPSGNPEKLAEEIRASTATVNADTLAAKKAEVRENILQPVTTALSDDTDPISGKIDIGTGHDLVLEALKIQVQAVEGNKSHVSVALKSDKPVDLALTLGSGGTTRLPKLAEQPAYTAPQRNDLAGEGLPAQLADLAGRMTACYALPLANRVKAGGTAAADITAEACKSLFLDQDPVKYKNNSHGVSSSGAFKSLFSSDPAAQGVGFSRPSFEYKVKNGNSTNPSMAMDGDVVFTVAAVDGAGHASIFEHWARPDASGKLYLSGNQSNLDIQVSPRAEFREFPNLSGKNFHNTGYNLYVNAKHPYAKVVVTSPKGAAITLLKVAGYEFFVIAKNGAATGSSVLRLAGSYADTTTTGTPRTDFPGFVWAGDADVPDSTVAAYPLQASWTFDFYTNASDTTPAVSGVRRRTLQRAPTLAELRAKTWPTLLSQTRQNIQSESGALGFIKLGSGEVIDLANGDKNDQAAWQVPAGAWSPTEVTGFGSTADGQQRFSDSTSIRPSARLTQIRCSKASATDVHCSSVPGTYAQDTRVQSINLSGRDTRGVQMNYGVDFRKL